MVKPAAVPIIPRTINIPNGESCEAAGEEPWLLLLASDGEDEEEDMLSVLHRI